MLKQAFGIHDNLLTPVSYIVLEDSLESVKEMYFLLMTTEDDGSPLRLPYFRRLHEQIRSNDLGKCVINNGVLKYSDICIGDVFVIRSKDIPIRKLTEEEFQEIYSVIE